jgi:hypothetical protein
MTGNDIVQKSERIEMYIIFHYQNLMEETNWKT